MEEIGASKYVFPAGGPGSSQREAVQWGWRVVLAVGH